MNDFAWRGSVRWIGPVLSRSKSAGLGRIWRWDEVEAETPGIGFPLTRVGMGDRKRREQADSALRNPPGARQPGLALLVGERPWIALGRHPVRHPREANAAAWHSQYVLIADSEGSWSEIGVFADRFSDGILTSSAGQEVARVERPGRLRSAVNRGDTLAVDGQRYGMEPAILGVPAGEKPRLFAASYLVGVRLLGPSRGHVRAELIEDRMRGFDGDVSGVIDVRWATAPMLWEAAATLCCLAAAIDGDHLITND